MNDVSLYMGVLIRTFWFIFIRWWLASLWISLCLLLIGSIIFLPFGLVGLSKTWEIATLKTSPDVVIKEVRTEAE